MFSKCKQILESIGEYILMVIQMIWGATCHPPKWSLVRNQLFDIGVMSLPVIAITGLSTGMVLAAQAYFQLSDKGLTGTTGIMVAKSMLVELGPILTAFMITGRVGAAITAELGSMRVTEQIDALKSMAVDPLRYLVAPRVIAMTLMVPILTVFSCAMGIFGGYLVAVQLYGMAPHTFFDPMPIYITSFDLISGFLKSFVFGMLIVTISCYRGMNTRGGAAGVGKSTTNSVVICYSAILLANFMLTLGLNASYWLFYSAGMP
ncbi:MAG: ABC transporter permease [Verrucomicrobia bacterium]|nr:ABC transporter permease [Verrucomicrobiota bacterium]MBS0637954.1 ABC transporter permease [Verrucomicrobiota bacterium]